MEIPNITDLISYSQSFQLQETITVLRSPFLIVFFVLLIIIIFLILRTTWLQYAFLETIVQFFTFKPYGIKKSLKAWAKIAKKLDSGDESEYKLAVVQADKMLDESLKGVGYADEKMEDKINKLSKFLISNREQVLEVHRNINDILYDPNYRLDLDKAKEFLEIYKIALVDLGVL